MGIGLPAHQVEEVENDHLFLDQRTECHHEEPPEQDDQRHYGQFEPVLGEHAGPARRLVGCIENIDHPADEEEESRFEDGNRTAEKGHADEGPFGLSHIMPDEGECGFRWTQIPPAPEGIDPAFEQAGDGFDDHGADIVLVIPASNPVAGRIIPPLPFPGRRYLRCRR